MTTVVVQQRISYFGQVNPKLFVCENPHGEEGWVCAILLRARQPFIVSFVMTLCLSCMKYWNPVHSYKTVDKITVTESLQRGNPKGNHNGRT